MAAILCHNPAAGLGSHSKKQLIAALKLAGIDSVYCSTKSDDFPEILRRPAELIVAAGGDGGLVQLEIRN